MKIASTWQGLKNLDGQLWSYTRLIDGQSFKGLGQLTEPFSDVPGRTAVPPTQNRESQQTRTEIPDFAAYLTGS